MVGTARLEQVIGKIEVANVVPDGPHPAPGMHERHYAPRTPLVLHPPASGRGAYLWITSPHPGAYNVEMPAEAERYAAILYDTLHRLDAQGLDWIAVEPPPDDALWAGVNDRLQRAKSQF
jgi:L-threonylcarbamoyladenylate synthase